MPRFSPQFSLTQSVVWSFCDYLPYIWYWKIITFHVSYGQLYYGFMAIIFKKGSFGTFHITVQCTVLKWYKHACIDSFHISLIHFRPCCWTTTAICGLCSCVSCYYIYLSTPPPLWWQTAYENRSRTVLVLVFIHTRWRVWTWLFCILYKRTLAFFTTVHTVAHGRKGYSRCLVSSNLKLTLPESLIRLLWKFK